MENFVISGELNKSTYFILPLIGLGKFGFGPEENFYNSYIGYNGEIAVAIKDKSITTIFMQNAYYLTDFDVQMNDEMQGTVILFKLPDEFIPDLKRFMDGKYSEMSSTAKENIRKFSGLPYREAIAGSSKVSTHKLLLVLDKSPELRAWIENRCDVVIPEHQELLEKPDYNLEYLDINTVVI